MGRQQLIREAEAAEELAAMISFRPDKERLLGLASRLRDEAATAEERSWEESSPPLHPRPAQRLDQ